VYFALPRQALPLRHAAAAHQSVIAGEEQHAPLPAADAIYNPDPNQIWNRLYRALYFRTAWDGKEYGPGELDPLLWGESTLSYASNDQAVKILDEFLSTHSERLIQGPLKRAILQRDMWAIFDWLSDEPSGRSRVVTDLQVKLAQAIRQVALTPAQLKALPDTYAAAASSKAFPVEYNPADPEAAFLPPDLFTPDGPWVSFAETTEQGDLLAAPAHARFFGARSVFTAFLRLPAGRQATLAYLKQLRKFPKPLIPNPDERGYMLLSGPGRFEAAGTGSAFVPNPDLPQFPPGTEVALVRRIILVSDRGQPTPTALTESVQIRVFPNIPSRADWLARRSGTIENTFEFELDRPKLFAGVTGGLRALTKDDREFPEFLATPYDWLEMRPQSKSGAQSSAAFRHPVLAGCDRCHGAPGIHSIVNTRAMWDGPGAQSKFFDSSPSQIAENTIERKRRQYNWGLLQGLWQSGL